MHAGIVTIGNESDGAITSKKQRIPLPMRNTARAMKYGPAAPVILLPHLSSVLKHRKTVLVQIIAHVLGECHEGAYTVASSRWPT